MHFFIPKVLLKDQKMLNLRRIKNDERGPSDLCASLTNLLKQTEAWSLCKNMNQREKTQVVYCGHPQNNYFMLSSNKIFHCGKENEFFRRYNSKIILNH